MQPFRTGTSEVSNYAGQLDEVPKLLVPKLQAEAVKDEVYKLVCENFAMRARTKRQLDARTLVATLRKEGHDVKKGDVARVFRFMSQMGLCTLDQDANGQIVSITDIKYTLAAIAAASLKMMVSGKPATADDFPKRSFVRPAPQADTVDHLTNATGSPLNARRTPSTTLAAPVNVAAGRHQTNAKPKVDEATATVTITSNKGTFTFNVTDAAANEFLKQML